jgi:hypothetical protein
MPGYGSEQIHLGQSAKELSKFLGKPAHRRKASTLREYWVYPALHMEAIVSRRSGRILSLFFHRGSTLGATDAFKQSEDELRRQYGEPYKQGGGLTFADGGHLGRWIAYRSGIAFFFAKDGTVKTVCISARSTARVAKPAARHGVALSQRIAALVNRSAG